MISSRPKGNNMKLCERKLTEYVEGLERLIFSTGESYFKFIFGNSFKAIQIIRRLCEYPRSIFSFDLCNGYFLEDDLVGIEGGYLGSQYNPLVMSTFFQEVRENGVIKSSMKLIRAIYISLVTPTIPRDSYYLAYFAISEKFRGYGYGSVILRQALERIKNISSECYLDVEEDNDKAIRLYESIGFVKTETIARPRFKFFGVRPRYRMLIML